MRDGRVAVEDGRVVWVGRAAERDAEGPLRDLGKGILLPGLVNAHCHLELSHLRGLLQETRRGFVGWVECLIEARDAQAPDELARANWKRALQELEDSGTVAVGDVSNTLAHIDLLEASRVIAVVFHELLGWDPDRADLLFRTASARAADLAARGLSRTRIRLAAHAPHSVAPALLSALVERGGPAAIHLAESEAEVRFLSSGDGPWAEFLQRRGLGLVPFAPPGASPVRYLDGLGALPPGLVAAHCVNVDRSDRAVLAERGVFVAVCPRSNENLGVGLPPVAQMLHDGVRLCLGTDSLASVESLDLMEDMAALHRAMPEVPAEVLVRMATLGGARALGLSDLGAIAPGRRAALAFVPTEGTVDDPLAFLVSGSARATRVPLCGD